MNSGGGTSKAPGRAIDASEVRAAAEAAAGMKAPAWLSEQLVLLTAAINGQEGLTVFGRYLAGEELRRNLTLGIQLSAEPPSEIHGSPLIAISGLPRSGTTLLQSLLACDEGMRTPRMWEAERSSLHPLEPEPDARKRFALRLRAIERLSPELQGLHFHGADEPEECNAFLQATLSSLQYVICYDDDDYQRRWIEHDRHDPYRLLLKAYQHLGFGDDDRTWVVKSPAHLFDYGALVDVLRPRVVVQLHRDPNEVLASWCDLVVAARRVFVSPSVDRTDAIARQAIGLWSEAATRASMAWPKLASNAAVLDIAYEQLVERPFEVIGNVYDSAGLALSNSARGEMHRWLDRRHRDRPRRVRTASDYGLDAREVKQVMSSYTCPFPP